jgi:hypothetical protein
MTISNRKIVITERIKKIVALFDFDSPSYLHRGLAEGGKAAWEGGWESQQSKPFEEIVNFAIFTIYIFFRLSLRVRV